ncbi:MAG: hypothetical protein M3421_12995 [Bacteroidota bacterium]|nr:hypothetical protein [Bacteroidota bacterium]
MSKKDKIDKLKKSEKKEIKNEKAKLKIVDKDIKKTNKTIGILGKELKKEEKKLNKLLIKKDTLMIAHKLHDLSKENGIEKEENRTDSTSTEPPSPAVNINKNTKASRNK